MFAVARLKAFSHRNAFLCASSSLLININKFQFHIASIVNQQQSPIEVFKHLQKIRNNLEYQNLVSPEYFNFARDIVDCWAITDQELEDKPLAYWFVYQNGDQLKWTYDQLSKNTKKAANAITELGNGTKWKKCMVILPKIPEWWVINLACMRLGTLVVQSTSMITAKDIQYRIQATEVECVITTPSIADSVDSIASTCNSLTTKILVRNDSRPGWLNYSEMYANASEEHKCVNSKGSDPVHLYFTSGTTSLPKRVVHNHGESILAFLCLSKACHQLDRGTVFWNMADTGWAKTFWTSLSSPLLAGATIFVHEMPQFSPTQTLEILQNYPVQNLCAPPTVYRRLLAQNIPKFNHLKVCFTAGEPLMYGQTETTTLIYNTSDASSKMGSIGTANPAVKIALLSDDGKEVPQGATGQIAVKVKPDWPLGIFKGYEGEPEKTKKVFVGDYYLTGDRAYMDEDGYYWYIGRSDDVITSSAYRIGPYEVETALQQHPDVLECAVIGVPDYERTQIVKAFVILRESGKKKDPATLIKELQEHVKKTTAPYKYPRQIEFIDELPKTISQKIKRAELRAAEEKKLKTNSLPKK